MKSEFWGICLILFVFFHLEPISEKSITVIIPSYNNAQWYKFNLNSVLQQNYSNYRIVYVDDCSPDGTGNLVKSFLASNDPQRRASFIQNTERVGALANIYRAVHSCEDRDLVVLLDGDDWFADDDVLSLINAYFSKNKVWFAHAQYENCPHAFALSLSRGIEGLGRRTPKSVLEDRSFRRGHWYYSGTRIFYAGLFKKIKKEDLTEKNSEKFFMTSYDVATVWPMMEMAGKNHYEFIEEVILLRNVANQLNDFKCNRADQKRVAKRLRAIRPYRLVEKIF